MIGNISSHLWWKQFIYSWCRFPRKRTAIILIICLSIVSYLICRQTKTVPTYIHKEWNNIIEHPYNPSSDKQTSAGRECIQPANHPESQTSQEFMQHDSMQTKESMLIKPEVYKTKKNEADSYIHQLHKYLEHTCDNLEFKSFAQLPSMNGSHFTSVTSQYGYEPLGILAPMTAYELDALVGDEVIIQFQVVSHSGKTRRNGGDMIRAWVYDEKSMSGHMALVTDHQNGSYSLSLKPLLVQGDLHLYVMLEMPLEALCALRHTRDMYGDRDQIVADFIQENATEEKYIREAQACELSDAVENDTSLGKHLNFDLSGISVKDTKSQCALHHHKHGILAYCDKPHTPLECHDLTELRKELYTDHMREPKLHEALTTHEVKLFSDRNQLGQLFEFQLKLNVSKSSWKHATGTEHDPWCSHCIAGYYHHNIWHHANKPYIVNAHGIRNLEKEQNSCLKNRNFYFFGDSTTDQLAMRLCHLLELNITENDDLSLDVPRFTSECHSHNRNLSIFSWRDGPNMHVTNFSDIDAVTYHLEWRMNYLLGHLPVDNLTGSGILFTSGTHSTQRKERVHPTVMKAIADYIPQLMEKVPGIRIMYKNTPTICHQTIEKTREETCSGFHLPTLCYQTASNGNSFCYVTFTNYDAVWHNDISRRILYPDLKGLGILNSWQMTASTIIPDDVHVNEYDDLLDNFLNEFLEHVCHETEQ